MSWKDKPSEHITIWKGVADKIIAAMGKGDIADARRIFDEEHDWLKDRITPDAAESFFRAWLMACFMKNSTPVPIWFVEKHGDALSEDETEVLLASHESRFDVFSVKSVSDCIAVLTDTGGDNFLVEVSETTRLEPGIIVITRLITKGPGSWFSPSGFLSTSDNKLYLQMASHRRFRDSWNSYLEGFFRYLQKKVKLSAKTADAHTENITVLTMFLENEITVDSFQKVNREMLEGDFAKFASTYIHPKPNMKKMRDSLLRFFIYVRDERGKNNSDVIGWLEGSAAGTDKVK